MDRPGYKLADRSVKLLQTIIDEDLEAFSETLKECQLDEVILISLLSRVTYMYVISVKYYAEGIR